jgi:imidazolonepropionase-like amidohydrolase
MDCAANADALLRERRARLAQPSDDGNALRSALHADQRDRAIAAEDPARCTRVIAALGDTIQVPTARLNAMTQYPPFRAERWNAALAGLPAVVADDWAKTPQYMDPTAYRTSGEWTLRMIPRLRDAGVPIGAGTDTPIGWAVPGFSLHRELEILVAAGLTPREALAAATRVPAQFFGLQHEMGAIAVGQVADLVLLEGNPLDNISNTQRITAVITAGRLARGGAHAEAIAERDD